MNNILIRNGITTHVDETHSGFQSYVILIRNGIKITKFLRQV